MFTTQTSVKFRIAPIFIIFTLMGCVLGLRAFAASAPQLSAPTITTTSTTAVISWTVSVPTTNGVNYGPTKAYGHTTPYVHAPTTTPSVTTTGLSPATLYYIMLFSKDPTTLLTTTATYTLTTQVSPSITSVSVQCSASSLPPNGTTTCAASVVGTGSFSSSVTWSASAGTIDANGNFTAPASGTATVSATSQQNTTKLGLQTLTVASNAPQQGMAIAGAPDYYNFTLSTLVDTVNGIMPLDPSADTTQVQVVFGNSWGLSETAGPPMTVSASIEYPQGTIWPLTFSGSPTGTLSPGGILTSDASGVTIPAGTVAYLREHIVRDPSSSVAIPGNYNSGQIRGTALAPNTTTRSGGAFDGIELLTTRTVSDGAINAGSNILNSPLAKFTFADVSQTVAVTGAGPNGSVLNATITGLSGLRSVKLSATASTTVSAATTAVVPADKTILASDYIQSHGQSGYGPIAYLGQTATPHPSACIIGDSIAQGAGANFTQGSWPIQALNPSGAKAGLATLVAVAIPYIQMSVGGEKVSNILIYNSTRFSQFSHCSYVLNELGTNDLAGGTAALEANWLTIWRNESASGSQVFQSTMIPRGTSTDNFLTLAGQSTAYIYRQSLNAWLRDGAPVSSTTGAPVAVGSSTATTNRAAYYDVNGVVLSAAFGPSPSLQPLTAVFETADAIESSRNSDKTMVDPANRTVNDAAIVAGSTSLTSATANFTAGDVGAYVSVTGAGAPATTGGATIVAYVSSTQVTLSAAATTTVSGVNATIGGPVGKYTKDGTHPNVPGHAVIGAAAGLTTSHWQ